MIKQPTESHSLEQRMAIAEINPIDNFVFKYVLGRVTHFS